MKNFINITMATVAMVVAMAFASFAGTPTEEAAKAVTLINNYRVANGRAALTWDDAMTAGTVVRAQEASVNFEHSRPDGSAWYTADPDHFYGENLAENASNAETVVAAWIASPVHRENILGDFSTCNIQAYVSADGTWYWANEFGYTD